MSWLDCSGVRALCADGYFKSVFKRCYSIFFNQYFKTRRLHYKTIKLSATLFQPIPLTLPLFFILLFLNFYQFPLSIHLLLWTQSQAPVGVNMKRKATDFLPSLLGINYHIHKSNSFAICSRITPLLFSHKEGCDLESKWGKGWRTTIIDDWRRIAL